MLRLRLFSAVVVPWWFFPGFLAAQLPVSEREDAQARIFIIQELVLERVRDLDFGTLLAGESAGRVDPRTSPDAGKFVLHFDDTQEWSVRYEASDRLKPSNGPPGDPGIPFDPELFGSAVDVSGGAVPLEAETEAYRTEDETFYFWVGGRIDTAGAEPGVYTGTFTLTVEPL